MFQGQVSILLIDFFPFYLNMEAERNGKLTNNELSKDMGKSTTCPRNNTTNTTHRKYKSNIHYLAKERNFSLDSVFLQFHFQKIIHREVIFYPFFILSRSTFVEKRIYVVKYAATLYVGLFKGSFGSSDY